MKNIRQAIKANDKGSSFLATHDTSKALQHYRSALNHLNEECKTASESDDSSRRGTSARGTTTPTGAGISSSLSSKIAVITVKSKSIRLGDHQCGEEHNHSDNACRAPTEAFVFQISNNSSKLGLRRVQSLSGSNGPMRTMMAPNKRTTADDIQTRPNKSKMRRAKSYDVDGPSADGTKPPFRPFDLLGKPSRPIPPPQNRAPRRGRRTAGGGGGGSSSVETAPQSGAAGTKEDTNNNKKEDIVLTMEQHQFCSAVLIYNTALTLHQKAAKEDGHHNYNKSYRKALVFYGEAKNLLVQTRRTALVTTLEQHRQIQADSFRILQAIMKNQVDIYHQLNDLGNVKLVWEELADLVKENHFLGISFRQQPGGGPQDTRDGRRRSSRKSPVPRTA